MHQRCSLAQELMLLLKTMGNKLQHKVLHIVAYTCKIRHLMDLMSLILVTETSSIQIYHLDQYKSYTLEILIQLYSKKIKYLKFFMVKIYLVILQVEEQLLLFLKYQELRLLTLENMVLLLILKVLLNGEMIYILLILDRDLFLVQGIME